VASPELSFAYWEYDSDEQSMTATGGRNLALIHPDKVGIRVRSLAATPIRDTLRQEVGKHLGLPQGQRYELVCEIRRLVYNPTIARDIVVLDTEANGSLRNLRNYLFNVYLRLNGSTYHRTMPDGTIDLELRESLQFILNTFNVTVLLEDPNATMLSALVNDLKFGFIGDLPPVLLLLCDLFVAAVQRTLADAEVPDIYKVNDAFPWLPSSRQHELDDCAHSFHSFHLRSDSP